MSASYTQSLRLTLQGDGDNPSTWGDVTNDQVIELIEAGVCGVAQVTCTGSSNVNIASTTENGAPDTARNMILQLVGTLGASIQLIVPAVAKMYLLDCLWSGPYTITIIPTGGSAGVTLTSGQKYVVYISGTTITQITSSGAVGALLAANNLSDLTSVSTALTNLGLGTMATQNANNVNITGGSISGVAGLGAVTSVAGRVGAVVLSTSDISGLGALALLNSVTGATGGVTTTISGTAATFVIGSATIQVGYSAAALNPTITFPTAFSSAPTAIFLTSVMPNNTYSVNVKGTPTTTGFQALTWSSATANPVSVAFYWMAIGAT